VNVYTQYKDTEDKFAATEAEFVKQRENLSQDLMRSFDKEKGDLGEQSQFYSKMVGELHRKLRTTEVILCDVVL
jgi:hypothetical protein